MAGVADSEKSTMFAQEIQAVQPYQLFQPLSTLPEEDDNNMTYYDTRDGSFFTPRRHWCFAGQIIGVERFIRLSLFVRDTNGAELRIAFHTEQRGSEFAQANLKPGNTVLVLYAHAHRFLDFSIGLRQEELETVKVPEMRSGMVLWKG
ncbi:hypothetical protein LTR91_019983 [Friedmanniomyces endolithicus]|uniref:Uncharacterized protein n=1 Tax=Friedmanniomyces endolithicus TaxID=329885 RepID=A0AAN6HAI4_9PEZI|nr:hypothetical protein LTS00_017694 [Friedmanniomyces endolithicus]KAK0910972.1 hypothetical protein LTR57_015606 [Friedmanniomyces endolithicus]KAK0961254.1 hypothetical protein LTR91_019983 [Friedmanniomyces endolithicus]KAK0985659.1 hypothetical protein LTS01_010141 [Friedmanniomyces endolithicus]